MISFALLAWPVLILVLARRLPVPHVVLICLIGGYLLLPQRGGWDFPLLPDFDKASIPAFTALLVALVMSRTDSRGGAIPSAPRLDLPGWLPGTPVGMGLLALLVIGTFLTVVTNGDRLVYGPRTVSGLRPYDAFSILLSALVALVPLFLGRKLFAHPDRQWLILHALVVAALAYSLLALYEIRMSPRINQMVYGYFPHSWFQHIRGGFWGWRPLVFLPHGLVLAIFFAMTILAAFGLARLAPAARRMVYLAAGVWLLATLFLTTSFGALVITVCLLPVVLIWGARVQIMVAAVIGVVALTYPMLRNVDAIPTDRLVAMASEFDRQRGLSLNFRFRQEDTLLAHARERPLFGWGGFGRNLVYDEETGGRTSVVDGRWIVTFGQSGWVGYIGEFGLAALPLILLGLRARRYQIEPVTAVLALVLAANLLDFLPNGHISPLTWLIAGAMLGRLELGRIEAPSAEEAAQDAPPARAPARAAPGRVGSAPVYSRQTRLHERHARQRG